MYELVIFDWDGTLMNSAQKISNCIRAAAKDLGIDQPSDQAAKNIIGLGLGEAMELLFADKTDIPTSKIVEAYTHHFLVGDDTAQPMFEGVDQGLVELQKAGAVLAVATGKSRRGLDRVLAQQQLAHHFITSRCADETRSKPHPQMLTEILDFTAIEPHKAIMVGDTSYDLDMAVNANVAGLGANYGVHDEATLRQAKAVDVLDSFQDIVDWLLDGRVTKAYG